MTPPEYLDCELRLADCDKACLVLGGREFSGRPALDDDRLQSLAAETDPLRYGSELFEALLPPGSDLLAAYRGALMSDPRQFLRLRLHLAATAPAALHALRWELLYDPQREIPLSCSREIAFSRYCPVPERPVSPVDGTPRLLVAVANPSDLAAFGLPPVDPAAARAALEQALAHLAGVSWELHSRPGDGGRAARPPARRTVPRPPPPGPWPAAAGPRGGPIVLWKARTAGPGSSTRSPSRRSSRASWTCGWPP